MASFMEGARPLVKSGFVGAAGGYVYDKFLAGPARQFLGQFAGQWTDAVASFFIALALRKHSGSSTAREAGYGMFVHELTLALESNLPSMGIAGGGGAAPAAAGGTWYQNVLAGR